MNRQIDYLITGADTGLRIEQYLRRRGYSYQNLTEIKRMEKSVLLNGEHVYMRQTVKEGDILSICIQERESSTKIPPVNMPLSIIYEDEDIIVIDKPAGMPIHPSLKNYDNSMANALAYYYQSQGKPFIFRCCNRLDRDTSGLTVVAKHLVAGNILSCMTRDRKVHREYRAIVKGILPQKEGVIDAPIARCGESIIMRCIDFESGEKASTHYRVVAEMPDATGVFPVTNEIKEIDGGGLSYKTENGHSLISLTLETGRTHQIRVHMKYLGYPLIGDYLYNPDMELISRQALHSYRMAFAHPITGEWMEFVAPLPADMASIIPEPAL